MIELGNAMNTVTGEAVVDTIKFLQDADSKKFGENILRYFRLGWESFKNWAQSITNIHQGFKALLSVFDAITVFEEVMVGVTGGFRDWARELASTEEGRAKITSFFEGSIEILKAMGRVLKAIGSAMGILLGDPKAVAETVRFLDILSGGLVTFAGFIAKALPTTGKQLNDFWATMGDALAGTGDGIINATGTFIRLMEKLIKILDNFLKPIS